MKKKLSFNKASKKKTGGGPYEEKFLSAAEKQIVTAAGITVAVEGLSIVKTFGSSKDMVEEILMELDENGPEDSESDDPETNEKQKIDETPCSSVPRRKAASKISLLEQNIEKGDEWRSDMKDYLKSFVELKKKSVKIQEDEYELNQKFYRLKKEENSIRLKELKMKQEEHASSMTIKKIDLEIKSLELDMLKAKK